MSTQTPPLQVLDLEVLDQADRVPGLDAAARRARCPRCSGRRSARRSLPPRGRRDAGPRRSRPRRSRPVRDRAGGRSGAAGCGTGRGSPGRPGRRRTSRSRPSCPGASVKSSATRATRSGRDLDVGIDEEQDLAARPAARRGCGPSPGRLARPAPRPGRRSRRRPRPASSFGPSITTTISPGAGSRRARLRAQRLQAGAAPPTGTMTATSAAGDTTGSEATGPRHGLMDAPCVGADRPACCRARPRTSRARRR